MREQILRSSYLPVLFLDDWPAPPKSAPSSSSAGPGTAHANEDDFELPGMNELKRWRLQMLLSTNTWGIPSLALAEAYKRMFNRELDIKELGFDDLASMISSLPDIFSIQEPDEITASMFPDYPCDRILHDARYGHRFDPLRNHHLRTIPESCSTASSSLTTSNSSKQLSKLDASSSSSSSSASAASTSSSSIASSAASSASSSSISSSYAGTLDHRSTDPDTLNSYAWINRDEDLPPNVVLAGEEYTDLLLPLSSANISNTRGVYRAVIASVANPDRIFLNIKSDQLKRLDQLSAEVDHFFNQCEIPITMYSIPNEFVYPGFPCLVRSSETKAWERASIIKRSPKGNKVLVETVDFGGTLTVNQLDLFLMPRQFFDFPRQALLVAIAGIKPFPVAGQKQQPFDRRWPTDAGARVRNFSDLKYWIDCLLLVAKETDHDVVDEDASGTNSSSDTSSNSGCSSKTTTEENNNRLEESSSINDEIETKVVLSTETKSRSKKRKRNLPRAELEVIACDRNDEDYDLFLDETLLLESYAIPDASRVEEISILKKQFKEVLLSMERPSNPLIESS